MNSFYCAVCGKSLNDKETFTTETNLSICKECYEAFQTNENYFENTTQTNENTFQNQYNNNAECASNSKTPTNIWAKSLKSMCYITLIAVTLISTLIGDSLFISLPISGEIRLLLGGVLGFIIGFICISVTMTFVCLCEDISAIRKNTETLNNKK